MTLYGSSMWNSPVRGKKVAIEGMSQEAVVHDYGMLLYGNDGKAVSAIYLTSISTNIKPNAMTWNSKLCWKIR